MRTAIAALGLLASTPHSSMAALPSPEPPASSWLAEAPPARPTRLAVTGERVWVGTERGLYRLGTAGLELVIAHEAVRDLAPAGAGLWVACERSLYFVASELAEPERVALGAGARPLGLAIDSAARVLVATDAGLFARGQGLADFRRVAGLPPGPVEAVRALGPAVFAATRGMVWQEREPERFVPRLRSLDEGWWELRAVEREGEAFLLVVPHGIWRVDERDATRSELGLGELRDLLAGRDRYYVASARGVFALPRGELDRAAPRLLVEREAVDLASAGDAVLTATPLGVVRIGRPASVDALPAEGDGADPERALRSLLAGEPDIERVQRAVLTYLELAPSRVRTLEQRAERVGLWPELQLGFGYDFARGSERQRDAVLSSGTIRDLLDASRQRDSGFDVSLSFEWQLAQLASPDQAIAISKERRELIELRDQVLERVNRLYFERRRVLARMAALAPPAATERRELEIRADELAAQLDAWTGGLFARLRHRSPSETGNTP